MIKLKWSNTNSDYGKYKTQIQIQSYLNNVFFNQTVQIQNKYYFKK